MSKNSGCYDEQRKCGFPETMIIPVERKVYNVKRVAKVCPVVKTYIPTCNGKAIGDPIEIRDNVTVWENKLDMDDVGKTVKNVTAKLIPQDEFSDDEKKKSPRVKENKESNFSDSDCGSCGSDDESKFSSFTHKGHVRDTKRRQSPPQHTRTYSGSSDSSGSDSEEEFAPIGRMVKTSGGDRLAPIQHHEKKSNTAPIQHDEKRLRRKMIKTSKGLRSGYTDK